MNHIENATLITSLLLPVYDVSRRETLNSIHTWLQEVDQYSMNGGKDLVKMLVGNKTDKPRDVPRETAEELAQLNGMLYLETSAKSKEGVDTVFHRVVRKVQCPWDVLCSLLILLCRYWSVPFCW